MCPRVGIPGLRSSELLIVLPWESGFPALGPSWLVPRVCVFLEPSSALRAPRDDWVIPTRCLEQSMTVASSLVLGGLLCV